MASVRSSDTRAEVALRQALHRRGIRFRLHAKDIAGTPDVVIRKYRVAVFVDGDMWHGNEHKRRGLSSLEEMFPHNTEFWCDKIRRNMARDQEANERLRDAGWRVVRIWASDILNDPDAAASIVLDALRDAKGGVPSDAR